MPKAEGLLGVFPVHSCVAAMCHPHYYLVGTEDEPDIILCLRKPLKKSLLASTGLNGQQQNPKEEAIVKKESKWNVSFSRLVLQTKNKISFSFFFFCFTQHVFVESYCNAFSPHALFTQGAE